MTSSNKILERIETLKTFSDDKKKSLIELVDFFKKNSEHLSYISYSTLQRQLKDKKPDEVMEIAMLLATSLNVLDICYEYYDLNEETYQVSNEDIKKALREGVFYHPVSGKPVKNFEERINLYFVLSDNFLDSVK